MVTFAIFVSFLISCNYITYFWYSTYFRVFIFLNSIIYALFLLYLPYFFLFLFSSPLLNPTFSFFSHSSSADSNDETESNTFSYSSSGTIAVGGPIPSQGPPSFNRYDMIREREDLGS